MTASKIVPVAAGRDKQRAGGVIDFVLPPELEASEPPEARGLPRDGIRLLVSRVASAQIVHTRFDCIGDFLEAGDVLVINTSGTRNAALDVALHDGTALELRLSTRAGSDDVWTVELRKRTPDGAAQFGDARAGDRLRLPGGASAELLAPVGSPEPRRLWRARLSTPTPVETYLRRFGHPVRYGYVPQPWPLDYYQNVYSLDQASAEMPSAGRGFSERLVARLVAHGIQFAPLVLDTGVSSLDDDELPYAERYFVPASTARLVNVARAAGGRVIAVGTTVVRALETVTDAAGVAYAGEGWTDLVITPDRDLHVDGLLTGLHAPRASHLAMLEAFAGRTHVTRAYDEALRYRYLWHEFGDAHLILKR
jgi:S-adenosylmethionine:tRNA ribosyltransferase-isomerase